MVGSQIQFVINKIIILMKCERIKIIINQYNSLIADSKVQILVLELVAINKSSVFIVCVILLMLYLSVVFCRSSVLMSKPCPMLECIIFLDVAA